MTLNRIAVHLRVRLALFVRGLRPGLACGRRTLLAMIGLAVLSFHAGHVQAAGTGMPLWRVSGFGGLCGSATIAQASGYSTRQSAIEAGSAAYAAFGCPVTQQVITGNFPNYVVDVGGGGAFITNGVAVSAYCPGAFGTAEFAPTTLGCDYTGKLNAQKSRGCEECRARLLGNPIDAGTGNKILEARDYTYQGAFPLAFRRTYNSILHLDPTIGVNWVHSYQMRVLFEAFLPNVVAIERPDGRTLGFTSTNGLTFAADADVAGRITQLRNASNQITGWSYYEPIGDKTELYDTSGKLLSIMDRSGLTHTMVYSNGTAVAPGGGVIEGTSTARPAGPLIRVEHSHGYSLSFGYDATGHLVRMTDPAGGIFRYGYITSNRMSTVTAPDNTVRTYHYNESGLVPGPGFGFNVTGITDENGARHADYAYGSNVLALFTRNMVNGGEVNKFTISYSTTNFNTTLTDPLGVARTYLNAPFLGMSLGTGITGLAGPQYGPASRVFDGNGNITRETDWNGNRTGYAWDPARNLQTLRGEGLTAAGADTPQTRRIWTTWHPSFRLPTAVAEPLKRSTYVYNGDGGVQCGLKTDGVTLVPGVLCSKTVQATTDANGSLGLAAVATGTARTWAYTYNENGQVLTADGPRTDLTDGTTYTYYANNASCPTSDGGHAMGCRGQLQSVTNALSQTTQITAYNGHGQPLRIVDPNGLVTTMAYDTRQRLTSRTVGSETTTYHYDGVGQLTKVTLPDASFLSYSYDSAHRLTGMQDNLGNRIAYTLNAMGSRTQEQVFDPANTLAQTRSRVYSNLNRLFQELGASSQITEYTYDNQGNVLTVKDPLNHITTNQYDPLNRVRQVTNPNAGVTQYAYNGLDQLTQVSDPRALVTTYAVDGLGNLNLQVSPDTGPTTNTYDAPGNLLTQTDAKGQLTTYAYDALNRVRSITFNDGSTQTYAYDQGTNGIGRLTGISETDPSSQVTSQIVYGYDPRGRVLAETRTVAGQQYVTAYTYDSAGRLSSLTYPSGRTLIYAYDALGRVNQIVTTRDAQSQVVVQNVAYHPFGGVKRYTLGNGQIYARTVDLDGRIASYTLGVANYAVGFDAASRITSIAQVGSLGNSNTYGYDILDRLTSAVLPNSNYSYTYDAVGNRLSRTTGVAADTLTYSATSNRIATLTPASGPARSFAFDPNGSTTDDGEKQFAYDTRGRLVRTVTSQGAVTYQVNALGQRVRKTSALGDAVFHYDTGGRLIAESDSAGNLKREYIYLGDIPVGVVQ